jgi:ABC-type transport system involved in cytochrome bd biosynthesis fused ATPase/permease subunit
MGELYHTLIVMFIGYAISFYIGWEFTLILIGAIPALMIGAVIMSKAAQSGNKEEMKAYSQCAGMAE